MNNKNKIKHILYILFIIILLFLTFKTYKNIKCKEAFIGVNTPVKVYIENIEKYAKSSSLCTVIYNGKRYKSILYPGNVGLHTYNEKDFYYDSISDIVFTGKVSYRIVYVYFGILVFFILLWVKNW